MTSIEANASTSQTAPLDRAMGGLQATATNLLGMIGVGPFLTIPEMVVAMNGPHILYAWLIGAVLALCDGLVYAQLGAALPGSGGPYVYLREAYRPLGLGRALSFAFIFQVVLTAPLSIAGGAVGFANYLGFFWEGMTPLRHHMIAALICCVMTALLYRPIRSIGRISIAMIAVVFLTIAWVVGIGIAQASYRQAFDFPERALRFDGDLVAATGATSLLAMYNYGGYNTVCNIGGELRLPARNLPRAIVWSIASVVVIYIATSYAMLGLVPLSELKTSKTVASLFIQHAFENPVAGHMASQVMNALVLFITASSLYALILGYSRVPYAAAKDGQFFSIFAKVHKTQHFPHVSLLVLCALSIPFCFVSLGKLVSWLMLIQILSQFIWQCAGVMLLHRYRNDIPQPFRMWLYPVPALVALTMWIYVFASGPRDGIVFACVFFVLSFVAYGGFRWSKRAKGQPAG